MEEKRFKKWREGPSDARSKASATSRSRALSRSRRPTQSSCSRPPRYDDEDEDGRMARPSGKQSGATRRKSRPWRHGGASQHDLGEIDDDLYDYDDGTSLAASRAASHMKKRSKSRTYEDGRERNSTRNTPSTRSRNKSLVRSERSVGWDYDENPYEHDIRRDANRSRVVGGGQSGRHRNRSGYYDHDMSQGGSIPSVYDSRSSESPRMEYRRPMGSKFQYDDRRRNDYNERKSEMEVTLMKKVYMARQRHEQAVHQLEKMHDCDYDRNYGYHSPRSGLRRKRNGAESPRRAMLGQYDYTDSTVDPYSRPKSRVHRSSVEYYDDDDREYDDFDYHHDQPYNAGYHHTTPYNAPTPMRHDDSQRHRQREGRSRHRRRSDFENDEMQPARGSPNEATDMKCDGMQDPQMKVQRALDVSLDVAPKGRTSVSLVPPVAPPPKQQKAPKEDTSWVTESLTVPNYNTKYPYVPPHSMDHATPSHSSEAQPNYGLDCNDDAARHTMSYSTGRLTLQSNFDENSSVNNGQATSYTQQVLAQRDERRLLPVKEEVPHAMNHEWHVLSHDEVDGGSEGRLTVDNYCAPETDQRATRVTQLPQQEQHYDQRAYEQQYTHDQNAYVDERHYEYQQPAQMMREQPRQQMTKEERDRIRAEKRELLLQNSSISMEEQKSLMATLRKRRDDSGQAQQQFVQTVAEFNQSEQQRYDQMLHGQGPRITEQRHHMTERVTERVTEEDKLNERQKQMDSLSQSLEAMRLRRGHDRQDIDEVTSTAKEEKWRQMKEEQEERQKVARLRAQRLEEKLLQRSAAPLTSCEK